MNALGSYAFGTLQPAAVAQVAAGCIGALQRSGAISSFGLDVKTDAPSVGSGAGLAAVAGIGVIALALVALRFAAGWYIGKQFDRPVLGALGGGLFGAPALGVLSFFPGEPEY